MQVSGIYTLVGFRLDLGKMLEERCFEVLGRLLGCLTDWQG